MRVGGTIAIMALLAPLAARAGFTSSDTIDSSWAGRTLYGNTVYRVTADTTLTGHNSGPALQVSNAGVTTVIYIPKGITLTVNGGDANGSTGADAGIRVPSGTTLIVTGGGKLVATGGNAANGGNGGSGSNGHQYYDDGTPGRGGNGGAGGGGAGPGIG
ncbi:MAG: hypothetical protein IJ658_07280, partial [Kiritimatiellae bacterium]|nr:hypothetical protein [Kiritimatiellia bacterium]